MPIREGVPGDFLCLLPPQGIKSKRIGRGKLVRLCILAFSLVFMAYLSNAVIKGKSPFFQARLVVNLLVSLMGLS